MLQIKFYNYSYFYLICDNYLLLKDLKSLAGYYVPNKEYIPSVREGRWNGFMSFVRYKDKLPLFPIGLLREVYMYCKTKGYSIDVNMNYNNMVDNYEFLKTISVKSKGKNIIVRENQWEAIERAILNNRCVNVCPTSFGKSLCLYLLCLYHIKYNRKTVIIVPTKNLVSQMIEDFLDYGFVGNINGIFSGQDKVANQVTVCTFQTAVKIPEIINEFENIIVDECHRVKSKSLVDILSNASKARYKSGWTGTLKEDSIERIYVNSFIGNIKQIVDTKTLMEEKVVADLFIDMYKLNYSSSSPDKVLGVPYDDFVEDLDYRGELSLIDDLEERLDFIVDLALSKNSTGIIAVKNIVYCQKIYGALIKKTETLEGYNIYQIRGNYIERNGEMYKTLEELKPLIESEKKSILVVTLQVFSTGISLKNIHFLILGQSTKSYTTVIQTIGRGLRVNDKKNKFNFIDIIDNFHKYCYSMDHARERWRYYKESEFKINLIEKDLDFKININVIEDNDVEDYISDI